MKTQFFILHSIAIFLHTICFIYAFSTEISYTTPVPMEISRVDYISNETNMYYQLYEVYKVNLPSVILIHGFVAFITVFFHIFVYMPSHYYYGDVIWSQSYFPLRWVEYSITCTLMTIASSISAGNNDLINIFAIILFGIALQSIGCAIEQRKEIVHFFLFVGSLLNFGISCSTIWYIISTPSVTSPQVIEFIAYTFYYGLFPLNCIIDAMYRKNCFIRTDWFYNVLSLSSKFALFWLQSGEVQRNVDANFWSEFQIFGLGVILPFLLLILGIITSPTCNTSNTYDKSTTFLAKACSFRVLPIQKTIINISKTKKFSSLQAERNAKKLTIRK